MKSFAHLLELARENAVGNASVTELSDEAAARRYLDGLHDEVVEVRDEVRENNSVYLEDELSDIAWDYASLLAVCEKRGLITSAENVLARAEEKYTERRPAFLAASRELWEATKAQQKETLKKRHEDKYGT